MKIRIEMILRLAQDITDTLIASSEHSYVEDSKLIPIITDFIECEMSNEAIEEIFDELDSYQHNKTRSELENEVDDLTKEVDELVREIEDLREQINSNDYDLDELEDEIRRLKNEISNM